MCETMVSVEDSRCLEAGVYLQPVEAMSSMQLVIQDVEFFFFKPNLNVLLYAIGLVYCIHRLKAPCKEALTFSRLAFGNIFQGALGTGKTQTILSILSAILHATPARVQSNTLVLQNRGVERELKRGLKMTTEEKKTRYLIFCNTNQKPEVVDASCKYEICVLVCAPSNSELDEIVLWLLTTGLRDGNVLRYTPKIVRTGLKPHHSVMWLKSVAKPLINRNKEPQELIDSICAAILDQAAIVFSTLSFSGSELLSRSTRGSCTSCRSSYSTSSYCPVAEKFGYGTSLFKRLQGADYPVKMLKTQYRMHPEAQVAFSRLRSKGKYQPPGGTRFWINLDEVEFVLLIYYKLVTMYLELKSSSQLAIISPYSYEVKTFKDRFKEMFGVEAEKVVDINTVDCFQGREKDVAIFLCVRANEERGIGFVSDFRRMNVGITRAKSSILVVGSAATLRNDEHWKNLIESAEQIDQLFKVSEPWASFFSNENPNNMRVVEKYLEIPDTSEYEEEASPVPVFRGMLNKNRWMAETIETAIKIKTKEASANTRHAGFYILPFW